MNTNIRTFEYSEVKQAKLSNRSRPGKTLRPYPRALPSGVTLGRHPLFGAKLSALAIGQKCR